MNKLRRVTDLDLCKSSGDPPVVKLVNIILYDAVKARASDIYIGRELENTPRVRYRVDGKLDTADQQMPNQLYEAVGDQLKKKFGFFEEREIPANPVRWWQRKQEPEYEWVLKEDLPDVVGVTYRRGEHEKRRGDSGKVNMNLAIVPIGRSEAYHVEIFEHMPEVELPENIDPGFTEPRFTFTPGLYLLSSSSDNGKTTTGSRMLSQLDMLGRVQVSVERKLGYPIMDGRRMLVKPFSDDYEQKLRALRLYSPDVMFFDDVEDPKVAEEVMYHAERGAVVLAAVPAKDALSSISNLERLGVQRGRVAENLQGLLSQRLVRRVDDKGRSLGRVAVYQSLGPGQVKDVRKDIAQGRGFGGDFLPSFLDLVQKLVDEGVTTEEEADRVSY